MSMDGTRRAFGGLVLTTLLALLPGAPGVCGAARATDAPPAGSPAAEASVGTVRSVLPPEPAEAHALDGALAGFRSTLGWSGSGTRTGVAAKAAGPERATPAPPELLAAYDRLRAADLLYRDRLAAVGRRLRAMAAAPEILDRWEQADISYREAMDRILAPLEAPMAELREILDGARGREGRGALPATRSPALDQALDQARQALDAVPSPSGPAILRAAVLPYGRLSLGQRTPATTPAVVPSYLDPTDPAAGSEDLAGSPLAPLSDAILQEAESLGYDYVRIFELVRNEIDTEWYAGAMKGAEETLRQGRGNDVDQASLLVALLRASGAPARFVRGVAELPVEAVADDLGMIGADPDRVGLALRRAGVAFRPVVRGGRVAAFEVEQVWVSARIPYSNYRGAVVDSSGASWIPLAPAITSHAVRAAAGVVGEMADAGELSVPDFVAEVLASPQVDDPLATLRGRIVAYLAATGEGAYEDALGARTLEPQSLGLLPGTLPMRAVAVTGESPSLPQDLVQSVRLVVRSGVGASSPIALDWSVPLAELAGRRVTLSYLPATVDDHETIDAFGGLHSVPLYLVRLRPKVAVDGRPRAVGETPLDAGAAHRIELHLQAPFGDQPVAHSVVAGGYYAFDLAAQQGLWQEAPEGAPADAETLGARLLARIAGRYGARWSEAEEELASLLGVTLVRPLPSVAVSGGAVTVETVLGVPEQLRWDGVTLDASLRTAEPVAAATAAGAADPSVEESFLTLSALEGSALEHRVFEDLFLVDGISADKGLALARQQGIEVVRLTTSNVDAELPVLSHPAAVETEIENQVRLGFEVEVPVAPVTRKAWTGSVWRVIDPQGRGAGYFISGGLAGGATTEPPGSWVLDFLADALAAPYAPEPADDPLSGAEVVKIGAAEAQETTVGKLYRNALAVLVRDAEGRPVKAAPVRFSIWSGGGSLVDGEGTESTTFDTVTNALGIATVGLRSGLYTADDPVYLQRRTTDVWPTRALVNTVEVEVASHLGPLVPTEPFELIAYPGPPADLRKTSPSDEIHKGWASAWAGRLQVAVEDSHGNPVSNADVGFAVTGRLFEPGCPPPDEFLNAEVFDECPAVSPRLGECGAPSVTVTSSVFGASAGVILGDTILTAYRVTASVEGLPPVDQLYLAQAFIPVIPLACKTIPGVLAVDVAVPVDQDGNNLAAARSGHSMARPLDITLSYARPKSDDPQSTDFSRMEWVRTSGDITLTVDNGGAASPVVGLGDGHYQSTITTGPVPAADTVTFQASDVQTVTLDENGQIVPEVRDMVPRTLTTVWSVLPRILGIDPDPPVLGPTGQTTSEVQVGYVIEPAEYRGGVQTEVDLIDDGEVAGTALGTTLQGAGLARIQRGFPFDVEHTYELQAVLNRGSEVEIRSDRFRMPLFQKILRNVSRSVQLDQDVDLLNQRSCDTASELSYTLTQPAVVTLEFRSVESMETDGSPVLGSPVTLIDGEEQVEGDHSRLIVPGELAAGTYEFTLHAVAVVDGQVDEETGSARVGLRTRDSLPVGHTLVQGVDLWDGHLSLSREDLSYPGRGPALAFRRSYSSNAGSEPGAMGVGWSHSYESRVVVTPCGEAIVIGGEGSGMRFVDDGEGGLRPLKGYHGTLIANQETLGFDFYAKSGTLYRYGLAYGRELYLESITDPNGNATRLVYESGTAGRPRLVAVVDPAGRKLTFHYAPGQFALLEDTVLTRVDGPEGSGQSISFSYDPFGNLIRAEREDGARSEAYTYATEPTDPFEDRHVLRSVTDERDGATIRYETVRGEIRATADVVVPSTFYTAVTLPEGGRTGFEYDVDGLASRTGLELVTRVTDPREETTAYALDQYGSPLRITDPLGHETAMTWAEDDVVMTSRTDANGVTTTFDYDADGNLLTETVTFPDPDGGDTTLSRSFTYEPASSFDPPYVKERVATGTNRNGATTRYAYDQHGNLLEQTIGVTGPDGGAPRDLVTSHTYLANGDRVSTTDPRGETTRYGYDSYGNLASVTDPVGAKTVTTYDARSLPTSVTDPLGRSTVLEYDTLGRLVRRELPEAAGESAAPEETFVYDDAADTLTRTDAAGRVTVTTNDLEDRVVQVDNAAGGTKVFAYDPAGNKILETGWFDDSTPRVETTFVYDAAGRLTERREPQTGTRGRTTIYAYDPVGNLTRETLFDRMDAGFAERVTESSYDGLNRKVEERRLTDDGPVVRTLRYDGVGNLVLAIDPLGRRTETEYDELNRPIRVTRPEGQETVTVYDGAGNPIEVRRLNTVDGSSADQVRTSTYDGAGRADPADRRAGGHDPPGVRPGGQRRPPDRSAPRRHLPHLRRAQPSTLDDPAPDPGLRSPEAGHDRLLLRHGRQPGGGALAQRRRGHPQLRRPEPQDPERGRPGRHRGRDLRRPRQPAHRDQRQRQRHHHHLRRPGPRDPGRAAGRPNDRADLRRRGQHADPDRSPGQHDHLHLRPPRPAGADHGARAALLRRRNHLRRRRQRPDGDRRPGQHDDVRVRRPRPPGAPDDAGAPVLRDVVHL